MDAAAVALTEGQQHKAAECFALLAPRGRGLREAVEFFVRHLEVIERSATLATLAKEVVAAKVQGKFSASCVASFQSRLGQFVRGKEDTIVSEFTTQTSDAWLRENVDNATTRNNYRRDLRTMFAFADAQVRHRQPRRRRGQGPRKYRPT